MMAEMVQSTALAEAKTDSLAELFSRDPEGLGQIDRARLVQAFRDQRARLAAAELAASGKAKGGRVATPKSLTTTLSAEDTGL